MISVLRAFSFLFFHYCVASNLTVEYYLELISQASANAQSYQQPQNNAEFAAGSHTNKTYDFGSYDFIIVGAGAAGNVLATRLSEIQNWKILLLEAGGEENDFSNIPSLLFYLQFSDMNWGYQSTPQKSCCLGMKDRKLNIPRGKSIGGSTSINVMMYVRGNPKDYDKWVKLGNPGWSYKEVLPYFIKSENSQIDGDEGYHGKSGFWNVEYGVPPSSTFQNFVNGNLELNLSYIDCNGRKQIGVSQIQLNTERGRRQSSGSGFLDSSRSRKNLKVVTKALVTKINIDPKTKIAQSVVFITNNSKFYARATKEIIISAGAVNSPQLLMLSGIGPGNHLKKLGIDVIEDLPVGQNLFDHPQFFGLTFRTNKTTPKADLRQSISEYLNGFGPLTNPIDAVGFLHTENAPTTVPVLEYIHFPSFDPQLLGRAYNYGDEITMKYLNRINTTTDVSIVLALLHTKSRGSVTLKSNDPIDFPSIDLNMLSDSRDVDNLIKGIEFILKLSQTEAFRKINATFFDLPVCTNIEKFSKKFWECAIRYMTSSIYHLCGTTSMGPNKTSSVVDANLKVHGIKNLRVVDAGVIPIPLSGHPAAATIMIAEKIADVIKSEYYWKTSSKTKSI